MPPSSEFAYANASVITPQLWVGGDLDTFDKGQARRQLDELTGRGLTHIVDVRIEWNDQELVSRLHPEIGYHWCGIDDGGQQVPDEWFDQTVGYVLDALADPTAIALTHCHMGINRGPSLGYAVLLAQGWDPVEAIAEISSLRPIAMVAYAEDAVRWAHSRHSMANSYDEDRRRLQRWRHGGGHGLLGVLPRTRQRRAGDET